MKSIGIFRVSRTYVHRIEAEASVGSSTIARNGSSAPLAVSISLLASHLALFCLWPSAFVSASTPVEA
jgi:hypothetical protein